MIECKQEHETLTQSSVLAREVVVYLLDFPQCEHYVAHVVSNGAIKELNLTPKWSNVFIRHALNDILDALTVKNKNSLLNIMILLQYLQILNLYGERFNNMH